MSSGSVNGLAETNTKVLKDQDGDALEAQCHDQLKSEDTKSAAALDSMVNASSCAVHHGMFLS